MFDPTIGRWTTPDPKGFEAADADLFRYVRNNPTNGTDPTGLDPGIIGEARARAELDLSKARKMRTGLGSWDYEDFARSAMRIHTGLFPDSECSVIGKGCIGLCELRSGSYLNSIGQTDPLNRKVKVFTTLEEAQRYQRWAEEENTVEIGGKKMWAKKDTVLFAVQ